MSRHTGCGGSCCQHRVWWIMLPAQGVVDHVASTGCGGSCCQHRVWWIMLPAQGVVDHVASTGCGGSCCQHRVWWIMLPTYDEDTEVEDAYYSEMRDAGVFDADGDWD
ncbi:unnamed protein product [Closterium sp. NIES-64]|nr:unnamed protein product [Closterium sp. NIES-64]